MNFLKEAYALFSLFITTYIPALGQDDFDKMLKSIYTESVPLIQAEELVSLQDQQDTVLLLDSRSQQEYKVSHLENAYFVDYDNFEAENFEDTDREMPVVIYCSVGYRSEKIGEKLQKMGFQQVYNLYGGIFQWKNQGYEVVTPQGTPTDSVHTFNESWSKWLKKGVKVY